MEYKRWIKAQNKSNDMVKNIAALSLSLGVGSTVASESEIWHIFPQIIKDVFSGNAVAVVFVTAIIFSYALPEKMNDEA